MRFFRAAMGAANHCLVGPIDLDYFKSIPIELFIKNLKTALQSGLDTAANQNIDLTEFSRLQRESRELDKNLNTNTMNQKNLEFLADQIKYTGFGENLQGVLKEQMEKGEKEFTLRHDTVFDKSTFASELHFKKSDQSDLYFFNSYKAMLQKENAPYALEQIFYVSKDNTYTMKEAFNLLEGRAVNKDLKNKEGEMYNSWVQLNFKDAENNGNFKLNHYHQNYGYDLEAALSKHSIKELETPKFKEDLLNSLKKGNLQSVTFVVNGQESKMYVEANPHFKTLKVYDANLQRINPRESKEEKQKQGVSNEKDKTQKQDNEEPGEQHTKKSNNRKKKTGQSM